MHLRGLGIAVIAVVWIAAQGAFAVDRGDSCSSSALHLPGCDIKGIITPDDERFYVMPGDARYDALCLDDVWERWFCDVEEAWRFGWRPIPAEPPPPPRCKIKGNNGRGGKIYHLEGSTYYKRTLINKEGERWFCTAKAAEADGFRAPDR